MTTSDACRSISTNSRDNTTFYYNIATRNFITTSYTCSILI